MINGLSATDRVRIFLNSEGKSYIPVSNLTDLATKADMDKTKFYQALYRMQASGEIEMESDFRKGENRRYVVGIKVKKLATIPSIATSGEIQKPKMQKKPVENPLGPSPKLPIIGQYIHQKNVLNDIAAKLAAEGFAPDAIQVNFEENPMAEEAISIIELFDRASQTIVDLNNEKNTYKEKADRLEAIMKQQIPQGAEALAPKNE